MDLDLSGNLHLCLIKSVARASFDEKFGWCCTTALLIVDRGCLV